MFEVIITVCTFLSPYTTELGCTDQRLAELPACIVKIDNPRLYHPTLNPKGDIFIKKVECKKMIPVAPPDEPGVASA
jgi:hypothetical protein